MTTFSRIDNVAVPSESVTATDIPAGMILYADLIDHLVYSAQGNAQDAEQRDYRIASQNAYREVAFNFNWQYYYGQGRIALAASYGTGTISSSGATVTLTGGTWPTWARFGRVQVGNVVYPVASRTSDSVIVLAVAPLTAFSGDTFTIFRNAYSLPNDFRGMNKPINEKGSVMDGYVSPNYWLNNERQSNNSGNPIHWTIIADPDQPGAFALAIEPYVTTAATLDFLYQRSPRRMRLTGYETNSRTGTVSGSASATTITGVGTTFTADMPGAVIRFGDTTNVPDGDGGLSPYTAQHKIVTVTDSTHVEVYPALSAAVTSVKFVISDPVDIWKGMQTALLRRCELELAIARGKEMGVAQQLYVDALLQAREADSLVHEPRIAGGVSSPKSIWQYPQAAI